MPYVLHLRDASDVSLDRLVAAGALEVEHAGDGGLTALMPDQVTPALAGALAASDHFITPAVSRDDGSVWTLRPKPVRIGRIEIVPADMRAPAGAVRLIEASAFGSGLHPTTALCLQLLDEMVATEMPPAMLDVGTGSGVLALAALRLGVPRVRAIDIDADAIRTAAENAALNEVGKRLELSVGGPDIVAGAFPLVVANVLAAPLIELAPVLVRRVAHRGRVVLSGIPVSVEEDVARAYRHLGMHHLHTVTRQEWVGMVLQASW